MPLDIEGTILRLPVVLFALTIHEFMHAWTAFLCGDDTAYQAGRITLNPLAHLDVLGTLCLILGPIGWAKPVPVNPANLRYETRRRDEILISGAGVVANFACGAACAFLLRFFAEPLIQAGDLGPIVFRLLLLGSLVNFGLAVFNLLPIPPLDGSHILQNLLPLNAAIRFAAMRQAGGGLLLLFVIGNRYLAGTAGFDLLGYPVLKLFTLFSGHDLG